MQQEHNTHKLIEHIRERINSKEKLTKLLIDHPKWSMLTSALDVLADTASAIEYYLEADYPKELGNKYLHTYGLFQCIMMQQDAAMRISISLLDEKFDWKERYPTAYLVREIRNDVAGHPTNRDGKAAIQLVQHSLSKESITYLKSDLTQKHSQEFVDVDVSNAIRETVGCVNEILQKIAGYLDIEYQNYKDQHKQRKMAKIFDGLEYAAEKVLLRDVALMYAGYQNSKRMVSECEEELVKRFDGIDEIDSFSYILEQIRNAYNLIDNELTEIPSETRVKMEDCLYQYLFDRLKELKQLSYDIDSDFDS